MKKRKGKPSFFYVAMAKIRAVQRFVISFQTNCELNTIPMLLTVEIQYSVSIKSKQIAERRNDKCLTTF
jgi:hypothetical protein